MQRKRILAIDPGITTGLACRDDVVGLFTGLCNTDKEVLDFIENIRPTVVVYERFQTAGRMSKYGLATIELVGQIRGFCYARGIEVVRHTPGARKAFQDDAWKIVNESKGVIHQSDALAHLLCYEWLQEHPKVGR